MALDAEVLYHELLEQLPVGVYRTSLNGQIIECNTSLADLLGYDDIEELRKTNVLDFYVTPADRIKHLEELGSNEKQTGEFELRRRDGKAIWVRDYPRALRDETGAIVYIDGIIVDATSQKETEETLSSSELDYQSVFENVREAIQAVPQPAVTV
jgi:PAS domain S-box-containing protein